MNSKDNNKEIEGLRLTSEGSGVGYLNGKATFVTGLLPGERAKVQIFEEKKNWQRGKLVAIAKESESIHRIIPPCKVFGVCGGCQLQHLSYKQTLLWKQRWVEDNLVRIGKIDMSDLKLHPTIGMEEPWRYRNKARLHVGQGSKLGYYQEKSNEVVPFVDCLLISKSMNQWIKAIETALEGVTHGIKTVTFRENSKGEGMLILDSFPNQEDEKELLKRNIENISWKANPISSIWGIGANGKPELIWGNEEFVENILDLKFRISPLAFLQVNPIQTRKLYYIVLQWAELTSDKIAWDLYSGIGTITLALARQANKVWGIEENTYAVEDARVNAELNSSGNVKFITGKVEDTFEQISDRPDVVILDPPRAGAHRRVLEGLIKQEPEKIIYVSCDPGTLARDLGILQSGGYRVREVQPVDMFPWSHHVESIIMMTYSGQKVN